MSSKQGSDTVKANTTTIETKEISNAASDVSKLPDDHPVHRIPPEKQAKMRNKGINPVLKAEMDAATNNGFMSKWGKTSMGQWYV